MPDAALGTRDHLSESETRRDFLILATGAAAAFGAGAVLWPFIDFLNPAADVLALKEIKVDLGPIREGQRITIKWQGQPVFVDHRTPAQIAKARAVDSAELKDPQLDRDRVKREEWLIVVGICTHLGCVPQGQRAGSPRGEWDGWFCACHGSHYDTSGRIRKGPAPRNLVVPRYAFLDRNRVRIG